MINNKDNIWMLKILNESWNVLINIKKMRDIYIAENPTDHVCDLLGFLDAIEIYV